MGHAGRTSYIFHDQAEILPGDKNLLKLYYVGVQKAAVVQHFSLHILRDCARTYAPNPKPVDAKTRWMQLTSSIKT